MQGAQSSVFALLYSIWGLITATLIVLLSYRATLSVESNQSFTNDAEQHRLQESHEQERIIERSRLTAGIIALTVLSGGLLLTNVGFSIYYLSVGIF